MNSSNPNSIEAKKKHLPDKPADAFIMLARINQGQVLYMQ